MARVMEKIFSYQKVNKGLPSLGRDTSNYRIIHQRRRHYSTTLVRAYSEEQTHSHLLRKPALVPLHRQRFLDLEYFVGTLVLLDQFIPLRGGHAARGSLHVVVFVQARKSVTVHSFFTRKGSGHVVHQRVRQKNVMAATRFQIARGVIDVHPLLGGGVEAGVPGDNFFISFPFFDIQNTTNCRQTPTNSPASP